MPTRIAVKRPLSVSALNVAAVAEPAAIEMGGWKECNVSVHPVLFLEHQRLNVLFNANKQRVEQQRSVLSVVQNGRLQLQWVPDQRRPAAVLEGNQCLTLSFDSILALIVRRGK